MASLTALLSHGTFFKSSSCRISGTDLDVKLASTKHPASRAASVTTTVPIPARSQVFVVGVWVGGTFAAAKILAAMAITNTTNTSILPIGDREVNNVPAAAAISTPPTKKDTPFGQYLLREYV